MQMMEPDKAEAVLKHALQADPQSSVLYLELSRVFGEDSAPLLGRMRGGMLVSTLACRVKARCGGAPMLAAV